MTPRTPTPTTPVVKTKVVVKMADLSAAQFALLRASLAADRAARAQKAAAA